MAEITKPIVLDETAQAIEQTLVKQNSLLALMVKGHVVETQNLAEIHEIVRKGLAQDVFSIGDTITVPWTDGSTTYQMQFDIVAFRDVTLEDGDVVPGMVIQAHYAHPFGVQFSQNQAFYCSNAVIPAGTYHFSMGNSWGGNVVSGKTYQFTLTKDVPVGGMLQLGTASSEVSGLPDTAVANWRVRTYANAKDAAQEIVALTEGTDGADLGVLSSSKKPSEFGINNMQSSAYGYNRWSQSAIRQYLNSAEAKGNWWTPKNNYDRQPNELASKDGFMKGFSEEFLNILRPVKIQTARNTASDDGGWDTTYDTFFLASLEEMYCAPQIVGEGAYFPYWKERSGLASPNPQYSTNPKMRTYALEAKASPQHVRLRSAHRGYAYATWIVNSSGCVYYDYATNSHRFAPACVIC